MAKNQQPYSHATDNPATKQKRPVPPTHVVIDPPLPASNSPQPEPPKAETNSPPKPLSGWKKPEWVIVDITAIYVFIAWLTLRTIKRQADIMSQQAADARASSESAALATQSTLSAIIRQADAMDIQSAALAESVKAAKQSANAAILGLEMMQSKERARISIEITSLSLRNSFPGVTYKVLSHGPTHAIVEKSWVITSLTPMFSVEWEDDKASYHRQIEIPNIFPESQIEIEDFIFGLTPAISAGIEKGDWFVHFRAKVVYSDLFGKNHETAIYKIYGQTVNPIYRLSGPKWILAESGNYTT
jgi:hypothetical protein